SEWTDGAKTYSLQQILEMFPRAAEVLPREYMPGLMFDICRELRVFFVETNRLSSEVSSRAPNPYTSSSYLMSEDAELPPPRVKHYSDEIVQRIRTVLTDYARRSQDRDRTFPERLVRFIRDGHRTLPERDIITKMAELEEKRKRLISLGLLDSERGLQ